MDFSTHAVQQILTHLDLSPSASPPWRQLMLLCFDQKDIRTFQTLQVIIDGLEKLVITQRNRAKRAMAEEAMNQGTEPREKVAEFIVFNEIQKQLFSKLARSPNSTALLKKVGNVYLHEWDIPQLAKTHFDRAFSLDPDDQELGEMLTSVDDLMTKTGSTKLAPEPVKEPTVNLVPAHSHPFAAQDLIRRSGRLLTEPSQELLPKRLELEPPFEPLKEAEPFQGEDLKTANLDSINKQLQSLQTKIETIEQQSAEILANAVHSNPLQLEPTEPESASILLNRSLEAIQAGELDQAVSWCRKAIALDANVELGWHTWATIGLAFFDQRRLQEAADAYLEAVKLEPNAVESWFNMGVAYFEMGKASDALDCYLKADALDSTNAKICCNLGAVYFERGEFEAAEEAFRRAVLIRTDYARAWDNLGAALGAQNKLEEALIACEQAVELKPNYPEAWFKRGTILFQQEKYPDAVTAFQKVLEIKADFHQALGYLSMSLARSHHVEQAREEALKLDAVGVLPDLSWMVWNEICLGECAKGSLDKAIEAGKKATELAPENADVWLNLAVAYVKSGNAIHAEENYRKAFQLKPDMARAAHGLGVALYDMGRFEEATRAFQQATEIDPKISAAWFDLGTSLQKENKAAEAVAAFLKVVQLDPDHETIFATLGSLYLHEQDHSKALEMLEKAVQRENPTWQTYRDLGRCYEAVNLYDLAAGNYMHASEIDPNQPDPWESIGLLYEKQGHHDQAAAAMRRALSLTHR